MSNVFRRKLRQIQGRLLEAQQLGTRNLQVQSAREISFSFLRPVLILSAVDDDPFFSGKASDPARFHAAIRRFDEENAHDPNTELIEGTAQPRELVYAQRLTDWVMKLAPSASEELRLAARCQHLARWTLPRDTYEMTRAGYLRWRTALKTFHARRAGEILRETGYPELMVQRVQELNLKKNFPKDPDSRVLEDALCLVFLQYQLVDLASRTAEDKIINALQKSWKKMTPAGQAQALQLGLPPREKGLLARALQDD